MNSARTVSVLLYHHVGPAAPEACRGLHVTAAAFSRQMATLAAMGHTTILPAEWAGYVRGEWELPANAIMITFDDAYEDLVAHALPVLSRHGFSATVFVPTALIGQPLQCNPSMRGATLRLMTAQQITEAAASGIEFGAHTRTHASLDRLEPSEVVDEIRGSRDDLAGIIGREVTAFAYPYGRVSPTAMKLASDLFTTSFIVENGLNDRDTPLNALRRTMVQHGDTVADVCLRARFGGSVIERFRTTARELIGPRDRSLKA